MIHVPESVFLASPESVLTTLLGMDGRDIAELQRRLLETVAEVVFAHGPLHLSRLYGDGTPHFDTGVLNPLTSISAIASLKHASPDRRHLCKFRCRHTILQCDLQYYYRSPVSAIFL